MLGVNIEYRVQEKFRANYVRCTVKVMVKKKKKNQKKQLAHLYFIK